MRKILLVSIIGVLIILGTYITWIPDALSLTIDDQTFELNNGDIYELSVEVPSTPVFDLALRPFQTQSLQTDNVDGVFTYVLTLRNWINQTAVFTVREHIHLNQALLIIDAQNHYRDCPNAASVMNRINQLVQQAHQNQIPVVFTKNEQILTTYGITAWELQPTLEKYLDDPVVTHKKFDAFTGSILDGILKQNDIHILYIAGFDSFGAIRATIDRAIELNYEVVLVADAHTDTTETSDITPELINALYHGREYSTTIIMEEVVFQR